MKLAKLWEEQYKQQQLWHDWPNMSDAERATLSKELLLHLHEELAKLQRRVDNSRYHLLKQSRFNDPSGISDAGVDVFKLLMAVVQLHGVTPEMFANSFNQVTAAVTAKWRWQQDNLAEAEVLLCDLDGVVTGYVPGFEAWCQERRHHLSVDINSPEMEDIKDSFHSDGGFRLLKPIPGAVDTLNRWRATWLKRRLVLVTARPYKRFRRIYGDTIWWCSEHRLHFDHILFEHDKAEAVRQVQPAKVVAHIEDRGKHALEVAATGVKVLKMPYGAREEQITHPNIVHVKDWAEIASHLNFEPEDRLT